MIDQICAKYAPQNFEGDMFPIMGGGGFPLKVDFFNQNVKDMAEKPFFVKPFFCIVTPCLSTGSNKIFKKRRTFFVCSPKLAEGLGG